jgi:hypothetical protein
VKKVWPQKYNFIDLVVDDSWVCCKIYDKNFSVSHGGENDITRHVAGSIHETNVTQQDTSVEHIESVETEFTL